MESFLQDLKHSIRMFLHAPAFTITAVLALALGVGANTAIFSVINTVLLRPMPYPDPDRFVFFTTVYRDGTGTGGSPATFNFWKAQTETVEYVAAWRFGVANYNSGGNPEQVQVTRASADFFPLCGGTVLYGRTFSKEEDLPRGPNVAVLAYGFWQRRFASDPNVIGKTLILSGAPYEIIGITGPSLKIEIDEPPDIYTPLQIDPNSTDQAQYFNTGGHLKAGVSVANANARFKVATEEFRRKYPRSTKTCTSGSTRCASRWSAVCALCSWCCWAR